MISLVVIRWRIWGDCGGAGVGFGRELGQVLPFQDAPQRDCFVSSKERDDGPFHQASDQSVSRSNQRAIRLRQSRDHKCGWRGRERRMGSWMGSGRHFVLASGRLAQQKAEKKLKVGSGECAWKLGKVQGGGALVFPANAKGVTACPERSSLGSCRPFRFTYTVRADDGLWTWT